MRLMDRKAVAKHRKPGEGITEAGLRELVETIAVPRHAVREQANNHLIGSWLRNLFQEWGYHVDMQGRYRNVIASTPHCVGKACLLVGAHYDTVPFSPGADDNGSAVAAMLTCARILAERDSTLPIVFVAFNNEEDGHLGSDDFVYRYLPEAPFTIREAQILEMVGYCSRQPGSQEVPAGLPMRKRMPKIGDFLGLVANRQSRKQQRALLRTADEVGDIHVLAVRPMCGLERLFPVMWRSDHAAFWEKSIPAVMWTDTAEFRNPHYHSPTDTPDTLDYTFLARVTHLLLRYLTTQGSPSA
ncbi:MAG: M20/M25/M40 family metallo-hydrolase [Acidobacteriota bacterium]|nr:M20/M25/M40 family metallo-hydrolase [Acidobacteriota bacterium]